MVLAMPLNFLEIEAPGATQICIDKHCTKINVINNINPMTAKFFHKYRGKELIESQAKKKMPMIIFLNIWTQMNWNQYV